MYTKTQKRVKIIECGFFVSKVYTGNRNCENFDPNARSLTTLEPNEIFNDFAISREPFDEADSNFFYFKAIQSNTKTDWTRSHEVSEVGAE